MITRLRPSSRLVLSGFLLLTAAFTACSGLTYAMSASGQSVMYVTAESYTGSDSLGNSFNFSYNNYSTGHAYRYLNSSRIGGTTYSMTCQFYAANGSVICLGTATQSNDVQLLFQDTADQDGMRFAYTETNASSENLVKYEVTFGAGTVDMYSSNTGGYSADLTVAVDGSGAGTVADSSSQTVATLAWTAAGVCSINYADAGIADEQIYLTNIIQALAD